jgi:hypothetical protein
MHVRWMRDRLRGGRDCLPRGVLNDFAAIVLLQDFNQQPSPQALRFAARTSHSGTLGGAPSCVIQTDSTGNPLYHPHPISAWMPERVRQVTAVSLSKRPAGPAKLFKSVTGGSERPRAFLNRYWHLLHNLQAEALQRGNMHGGVGKKPDAPDTQIGQDLASQADGAKNPA